MEKTKSRELWIDVCKSVLIYFMVLGHCGFIEYNKWFYAFHMPCFFMISGYLYKSHSPRVIIKRLFIPVLCFSVINVCWKILIGYISNDLDVYMLLRKGLTTYFMSGSGVSFFPGVWFICVLFFCRCMMGDLILFRKINGGGRYDLYIAIICIVITVLLPKISSVYDKAQNIYIIKTISCLPFMLIGRALHRYGNEILSLKVPAIISCVVLWLLLTNFNGDVDINSSEYGKSTTIMYINALIASIALWNICRKISWCKFFFETLSKGTLLILGLHIIILSILKMILGKIGLEYIYAWGLIFAFFVLLICIPFIRFSDKKCKWVIGK